VEDEEEGFVIAHLGAQILLEGVQHRSQ